jgi:carbon monoxide dehydrogenase subunit G
MMRVKSSIVIHRPIETVFAYVSDVKQISWATQAEEVKYMNYCFFGTPVVLKTYTAQLKEIRQTSTGPLDVGTTFVQVAVLPFASFETTFQITKYDPPRAIAFKFNGRAIPFGEARIRLTSLASGTRITGTMKVEGGFYKLAGFFLATVVKQQLEINIRGLKERLESLPEANA